MIFDTHSHLQFDDYEDIEKELSTMKELWVEYTTLIWSDFESTNKALKIAKKYSNVFVVAWIKHPIDSTGLENLENEIIKIRNQIIENRKYIVWIWEAGFDYFHLNSDKAEEEKNTQTKVFIANIDLAKEFNLPLIIHIRDAWEDWIKIIKENNLDKFVIHCYTWNLNQAQEILELSPNAYIWFSWIVTFKNAKQVAETATQIPLDRILVETDAPYLAPDPHRGKLNTSWYTKYILDKIKELRKEAPGVIEKQVFENSLRFYWIKNIDF